MTKRYFSGATETQALIEAAAQFGVQPEEIAFEPVSRRGSLRGRTKAIIAVDDEAPTKPAAAEPVAPRPTPEKPEPAEPPAAEPARAGTAEPSAPASGPAATEAPEADHVAQPEAGDKAASEPEPIPSEPTSPAPPTVQVAADEGPESSSRVDDERSEEAVEPVPVDEDAARREIEKSFEALLDLADLDVDPSVDFAPETPLVNVTGPDREWLLDGEGDVLLALEHLSGRMLYRGGCPVDRVRVDSDGYRESQDEALRQRAREALQEAEKTGRPVVFEPLSPAERRVIHLAIEASDRGRSRSEGSGYRRRVRVDAQPPEADAVG